MGKQIDTAFTRKNIKGMGEISEHKKYNSLMDAIAHKDKKAIAEFKKEAESGGIIQLTG